MPIEVKAKKQAPLPEFGLLSSLTSFLRTYQVYILSGGLLVAISLTVFYSYRYFKREHYEKAWAAYDQAVNEEDTEKSAKLLRETLKQYPSGPTAPLIEYALGNQLEKDEKTEKALQRFKDIERKFPDSPISDFASLKTLQIQQNVDWKNKEFPKLLNAYRTEQTHPLSKPLSGKTSTQKPTK